MLELMIVCGLAALLAVILGSTWSALGRPALDADTRCRIVHEASLATSSLARDLAGSLADAQGRIGGRADGRLVGRLQPSGDQLWLCFDGGSPPNGSADWAAPDTVIVYTVQDGALVRTVQATGATYTIAQNVQSLATTDLGDRVQIALTFQFRDLTQTYTFIAIDP
jgi:hypothetical protein